VLGTIIVLGICLITIAKHPRVYKNNHPTAGIKRMYNYIGYVASKLLDSVLDNVGYVDETRNALTRRLRRAQGKKNENERLFINKTTEADE